MQLLHLQKSNLSFFFVLLSLPHFGDYPGTLDKPCPAEKMHDNEL